MKTLQNFLKEQFDDGMMLAVLSGQRKKEPDVPSRVRIRPVEIRGERVFQATATVGTKAIHKNYTLEEVLPYVEASLTDGFSQLQIQGQMKDGAVLVSKKGKQTIKTRPHEAQEPVKIQSHNRVKQYILKEGIPVPFLVDLGVMNKEGKVHTHSYDKFKQINRFLEFIEDILPSLQKDREVTILDFGCGKSYLTFAMYYYLKELKGYDVNIIGLDLKEDVIKKCSSLARKYGYEKLHFLQGDIADYEGVNKVDMVVTLHACDKATDYALAKAVEWDAEVILSVPCCQHELNYRIQNDLLEPVLKYGILKERMSALITDGIRAELLESEGYHTQILEFIDMEHTPKNLLIRAVKTGDKAPVAKLSQMTDAFNGHLTLEKLLYPEGLSQKKGV
nr:SAM-dependent methyltransferase [uncultured Blautia sp.]